jgi:hypothetical protein
MAADGAKTEPQCNRLFEVELIALLRASGEHGWTDLYASYFFVIHLNTFLPPKLACARKTKVQLGTHPESYC